MLWEAITKKHTHKNNISVDWVGASTCAKLNSNKARAVIFSIASLAAIYSSQAVSKMTNNLVGGRMAAFPPGSPGRGSQQNKTYQPVNNQAYAYSLTCMHLICPSQSLGRLIHCHIYVWMHHDMIECVGIWWWWTARGESRTCFPSWLKTPGRPHGVSGKRTQQIVSSFFFNLFLLCRGSLFSIVAYSVHQRWKWCQVAIKLHS